MPSKQCNQVQGRSCTIELYLRDISIQLLALWQCRVSNTPLFHLQLFAGCAEGAATLTADLVDLGYTKTIVAITLDLIDRKKSDIVVKVRFTPIAYSWTPLQDHADVIGKRLLGCCRFLWP